MYPSKTLVVLVLLAFIFSPCLAYDCSISVLDPIKQELTNAKLEKIKNEFQQCLRDINYNYLTKNSRKSVAEREAKKYFYQNKEYSKVSFERFMGKLQDTMYSPLKSQFKMALHKGNIDYEESAGGLIIKSTIAGVVFGGVVYYAATAYLASQAAWWVGVPVISSVLTYLGYSAASGPPGWLIAAAVALGSGIYLLYKLVRGPTESDIAKIIENALAGQEKEWDRFKVHVEDSFNQIAEQAAKTEVDYEFADKVKASIVLYPTFARVFIRYGNEMKNLKANYNKTFNFDGIRKVCYKYSSSVKLQDLQTISDSLIKWQKASSTTIHWLQEIGN